MKKAENVDLKEQESSKKDDAILKDRTDEELKQLAVDIIDEKFFSTIGMPEHDFHLLSMIFMPLALMDEETANGIGEKDPVAFYADMSKRLQRSINGYPIFGEVGMILRSEWERFAIFYNQYLNMKKSFLNNEQKSSILT